jgi:hypothetical protein
LNKESYSFQTKKTQIKSNLEFELISNKLWDKRVYLHPIMNLISGTHIYVVGPTIHVREGLHIYL